jgi:hypothetical protein
LPVPLLGSGLAGLATWQAAQLIHQRNAGDLHQLDRPKDYRRVGLVRSLAAIGFGKSRPDAATRWALREPRAEHQRMTALQAAARTLARRDFDAALRWSETLDDAKQRDTAVLEIIGLWPTERDVEPAMALISKVSTLSSDSSAPLQACKRVARLLARKDPQAAIDWADSLRWEGFCGNLYEAIPIGAAEVNVEKTIEFAKHQHGLVASGLAKWLVEHDREVPAELIESVKHDELRYCVRHQQIRWLSQHNLEAAVKAAERIHGKQVEDGSYHGEEVAYVAAAIARRDPQRAVAWIRKLEARDGVYHQAAWHTTASAWAEVDPAAAAKFVATLPPNRDRSNCAFEVVLVWSQSDAPAAAKLASDELRDAHEIVRRLAREAIIDTWGKHDPDAVVKWITEQKLTHEDRLMAYEALGRAWAQTNPRRGIAWTHDKLADADLRISTLIGIAQGLLPESTAAALKASSYSPFGDPF